MQSWPLLVHYCDACHYNTPVSYSAHVWAQQHVCNHCGHASTGADLAGHTNAEMNRSQHDELAQLFAQSMHLSSTAAQRQEQPQVVAVIQPLDLKSDKGAEADLPYISAHYTGMTHLQADTSSEPSRSPPPPYHEAIMPSGMADVLRQHGINPSALLPNQIQLLQNADDEQRLRLLQLWRISPPSYPLEQHLSASLMETSVEREEALAAVRHEQKLQHAYASAVEEHMLDTHIVQPISPIRSPGEPAFPPAARMRAASIASSRPATRHGEAEPYMVSMYAADQAAKSTDPVFAASPGMWYVPSMGSMENQYGMYEQVRNHADWERMNERIARERLTASNEAAMDSEMVL